MLSLTVSCTFAGGAAYLLLLARWECLCKTIVLQRIREKHTGCERVSGQMAWRLRPRRDQHSYLLDLSLPLW
jgi:hypothetical protein